jgi:ATP-dependent Clp protease ATP-binding subunit ClpB
MAQLAHEGYDPAFGARPLKRIIQREIGDPTALLILDGTIGEGGSVVVDSADPDEVGGVPRLAVGPGPGTSNPT